MPIFDQGYQHWKGELSGHGWRWLAVTRHGIRVGFKSFLIRMLLLAAVAPALALAGVISIWGMVEQKSGWAMGLLRSFQSLRPLVEDPPVYRVTAWTLCFHYFIIVEMYFIMVLVLLVGPNLISQDLRFNSFPLYFSRPVRRIDYFAGKLGVIGFFLGLVAMAPAVLAWVLGLLFSLSFHAIIDTFNVLLGVVTFGVVVSLSAGLFILALSSLSRNSRYIAAFWGGMWFLTWTVSLMFEAMYQSSLDRERYVLDRQLFSKNSEIHNLKSGGNPQDQFFDPRVGAVVDKKMNFAPAPLPEPPGKLDEMKWREEEMKRRKQDDEARGARIVQLHKELDQLKDQYKKYHEDAAEMARADWRPIISYTDNLQRIGFALIDSQSAFEKLDDLLKLQQLNVKQDFNYSMRDSPLSARVVPQYPWYWSALVLLALGGLSLWILHKRVTSLDRLR